MTTNPADDLASKILEKENSDRQEIALLLDNYLGKEIAFSYKKPRWETRKHTSVQSP